MTSQPALAVSLLPAESDFCVACEAYVGMQRLRG
jgi:hypothetical protein